MEPQTVHEHRDQLQVVDVREEDEWVAGRIEGARHIPLGQLAARIGELDRHRPVATVCRSGGRAGKAAGLLTQAGITADTMDGGMLAWAGAGLPVTTPDGRPGHVA